MNYFSPPVTVIRVPKEYGSAGYGAKIDGNKICIPFNPAVMKYIKNCLTNVATMSREEFDNLPLYEDVKS